MTKKVAGGISGIVAALLMTTTAPTAIGAEQGSISAFAAWDGKGRLFDTGVDTATFVGALGGTLYVDTEKGPIASGAMVCPVIVEIDLKDRSQAGSGSCAISSPEGDRVYADIDCKGYFLIGCTGKLTITGGTGRFSGISGDSPVVIRSDFGRLEAPADDPARPQATGILYLQELQYKIP
jgi:hypothetical protein